jgi:hemoglobin
METLDPRDLTEEALGPFLDAFYAKVRRDPVLAPVFDAAIAPDAWPHHLGLIRDFWASVLFKTGAYRRNPFAAHVGKGIEPAHFARWLALFDETAAEMFKPDSAAILSDRAHRIGNSLQSGLFFRPTPEP